MVGKGMRLERGGMWVKGGVKMEEMKFEMWGGGGVVWRR